MLCTAKRPVILTEEVGKDLAAVERLVELAETLGAPVFDAWQPGYANFPRSHPLYGGVAPDMKALLEETDLLFCVEAVVPAHPPSLLSASKARLVFLGEETHVPGEETIKLAVMATVMLSIFAHGFSALPGIALYTRKVATLDAMSPETRQ